MGNSIEKKYSEIVSTRRHINQIQLLLKEVMQPGQHYGTIPGCGEKKVLFKAGAEYLSLNFRLVPEYQIDKTNFDNGHREYSVICILRHIETGLKIGEGLGSCSTLESKYRYRTESDFEIQDCEIPKDYRNQPEKYRKQGFGAKQIDGQWRWVKFGDAKKIENPDIADVYNTVLKMAKKRAFVDANITACAASDIFTQDLDEEAVKEYHQAAMQDLPPIVIEPGEEPEPQPQQEQEPKQEPQPQPEPEKPDDAELERTFDDRKYKFGMEIENFFEGDQKKAQNWLAEKTRNEEKQMKGIISTAQIRSEKQLNYLKGAFKKFKGE